MIYNSYIGWGCDDQTVGGRRSMLGNRTEGDKAKRMRREKMITGTNSRNNGGGGSGGRTSGSTRSKTVNTSISMVETTLKDKEPTGSMHPIFSL